MFKPHLDCVCSGSFMLTVCVYCSLQCGFHMQAAIFKTLYTTEANADKSHRYLHTLEH